MNERNFNNLEKLAQMSIEEWDGLCRHCGMCCHCSVRLDEETVAYSLITCEHHDIDTRKCNVYCTERAKCNGQENPVCHKFRIADVIKGLSMPDCCVYPEFVFGRAEFSPKIDKKVLRSEKFIKEQIPESTPPETATELVNYCIRQASIPGSTLWRERYNSKQGARDLKEIFARYGTEKATRILNHPQNAYC